MLDKVGITADTDPICECQITSIGPTYEDIFRLPRSSIAVSHKKTVYWAFIDDLNGLINMQQVLWTCRQTGTSQEGKSGRVEGTGVVPSASGDKWIWHVARSLSHSQGDTSILYFCCCNGHGVVCTEDVIGTDKQHDMWVEKYPRHNYKSVAVLQNLDVKSAAQNPPSGYLLVFLSSADRGSFRVWLFLMFVYEHFSYLFLK